MIWKPAGGTSEPWKIQQKFIRTYDFTTILCIGFASRGKDDTVREFLGHLVENSPNPPVEYRYFQYGLSILTGTILTGAGFCPWIVSPVRVVKQDFSQQTDKQTKKQTNEQTYEQANKETTSEFSETM